jgi:hypothetical protein
MDSLELVGQIIPLRCIYLPSQSRNVTYISVSTHLLRTMKHQAEIEYEKLDGILDKLSDYSVDNDNYQILIHGRGGKPRSFYRELSLEKDIDLIWTGWSGPLWAIIFSFIPGQSGLIKLKNKNRLKEFYNEIGAQSFCALYFVDRNTEKQIIELVTKKQKVEISDLIENSDSNFMLDVYFDHHGGQRDGEVVYKFSYTGQKVDQEIATLLSLE